MKGTMYQQRFYKAQCPKCQHEFETGSYSVFQVEVPQEVPELRAVISQTVLIRAAPCPECYCGTPINSDAEWRWKKYDNASSSNPPERSNLESTHDETTQGLDSHAPPGVGEGGPLEGSSA